MNIPATARAMVRMAALTRDFTTAAEILAMTDEEYDAWWAVDDEPSGSGLDFHEYGDHNMYPRTGTCGHCGGTLGGCRCF